MKARQNWLLGSVLVLMVGLAGTYKLGPKFYNRVRLSQLQGRHIYDEKLNAQDAFNRELAHANGAGKRLIVMLGGNWCQWCLALPCAITSRSIMSCSSSIARPLACSTNRGDDHRVMACRC
jgi:hypothetical protein